MGAVELSDRIGQTGDKQSETAIDLGIVIAGPLDPIDQKATAIAIRRLQEFVSRELPQLNFGISRIGRPELIGESRIQPSELLQQAVEERNLRHLDFVFVLTASELTGHYRPYCFAALSRPLDAAVFSLSLIDPKSSEGNQDDQERIERIASRLYRLLLHALGHLCGLAESNQPSDFMHHPGQVSDLEQMQTFDPAEFRKLKLALAEISDQRLEEGSAGQRLSKPAFLFRAAWINRREIAEAVYAARPWQFPRRLSRLTIAAVSTVAVLAMTAEAWDLALSQSTSALVALTLVSLVVTTAYVMVRQQLLIWRATRQSEQSIVTSVSATFIVLVGMTVTWVGLLAIVFLAGWSLFSPTLIATWASSSHLNVDQVGGFVIAAMASFSASIGLLIGALGASFESQNYFRHIIFVDEEI